MIRFTDEDDVIFDIYMMKQELLLSFGYIRNSYNSFQLTKMQIFPSVLIQLISSFFTFCDCWDADRLQDFTIQYQDCFELISLNSTNPFEIIKFKIALGNDIVFKEKKKWVVVMNHLDLNLGDACGSIGIVLNEKGYSQQMCLDFEGYFHDFRHRYKENRKLLSQSLSTHDTITMILDLTHSKGVLKYVINGDSQFAFVGKNNIVANNIDISKAYKLFVKVCGGDKIGLKVT
eukprot:374204_1